MSSVCDCPFCGQPTAIPEDLDSGTLVRCPLCEFEFPSDEALINAVEAPPEHVADLPPELIPFQAVSTQVGEPAVPETPDPAAATSVETAELAQPSPPEDGTDGETLPAGQPEAAESVGQPAVSLSHDATEVAATNSPSTEPPVGQAEGLGSCEMGGAALAVAVWLPSAAEVPPTLETVGDAMIEPPPPTDQQASEVDLSDAVADESTPATAEVAAAMVEALVTAAQSTPAAAEPCAGLVVAETALAETPSESPHEGGQAAEEAEHEETGHAPFDFGLKGPEGLVSAATLARRDRRRGNPVRTVVGVVVFGLLGLAAAYGLVVGLSRLGFSGRSKPPAAEVDQSGAEAKPTATASGELSRPPEPKSFDEWPGLDENRFTGAPKDVQSATPARPPKGPGGRKSP